MAGIPTRPRSCRCSGPACAGSPVTRAVWRIKSQLKSSFATNETEPLIFSAARLSHGDHVGHRTSCWPAGGGAAFRGPAAELSDRALAGLVFGDSHRGGRHRGSDLTPR